MLAALATRDCDDPRPPELQSLTFAAPAVRPFCADVVNLSLATPIETLTLVRFDDPWLFETVPLTQQTLNLTVRSAPVPEDPPMPPDSVEIGNSVQRIFLNSEALNITQPDTDGNLYVLTDDGSLNWLIPGGPPVDVRGAMVTRADPEFTQNALTGGVVFFNEDMNQGSFAPEDVSVMGPSGPVPVGAVNALDPRQFRISFAPQRTAGDYTLVVGPDILDLAGNQMNQDGDAINGEVPDDQFNGTFTVGDAIGPQATGADPEIQQGALIGIFVNFNENMDTASFTTADVRTFAGPGGPVLVRVVDAQNARQFRLSFDPQRQAGDYTLVIGPDILDPAGNPMNQDGDAVNGEDPDDRFTDIITFAGDTTGPHVRDFRQTGNPNVFMSFELTFSEPLDPASLGTDDVIASGPGGGIPVVRVLPGSPTQVLIDVEPQNRPGTYTLRVGPDINDASGNPMDQDRDGNNGENPDDVFVGTIVLTPTDPDAILELARQEINALPDGHFADTGLREALLTHLDIVQYEIRHGDRERARNDLAKTLRPLDGCASPDGRPGEDDWIINCTSQLRIRSLLQEAARLL